MPPETPGVLLAGLGDEAGRELSTQVGALTRLGWRGIELRTVGGVALADLSEPGFGRVVDRVAESGLTVVAVASRIGSWSRPITGDLFDDLEELDVLAARCARLGTRYVRIMSYPNDGLAEDEWGRGAMDRIALLTRRAEDNGLVLLHENCAGWAGADADRMLRLIEYVDSAALRLLFDIGNGVAYGYDAYELLTRIAPYVAHVHVKDAVAGPAYVAPGRGGCRVADCLRYLLDHGYVGAWSIEPHLSVRPHEGVDRPDPDEYVAYGRVLETLIRDEVLAGLSTADHRLLVDLLGMPTAGPLETGDPAAPLMLWEAQRRYARAAAGIGFATVHHAPAVVPSDAPLPVREAATDARFLAGQPNLVLCAGVGTRVMFNVHLDTVVGLEPVSFDGARFFGRGAVDAKGPAVGLLAGIRAARRAVPELFDRVEILIQAVSGEEGGAMGAIGTRPLVEAGYTGRVNVFCEPTGLRYLTRAAAASTARIRVDGRSAIDDAPQAGHNATVLLGHLARHLAATVECGPGGRMCIAGLHTGDRHNRVYGTGELLVNLAYRDAAEGRRLEAKFADAVAEGLTRFENDFAGTPTFGLTAKDATAITRLDWLKRGLPTLDGCDPWAERLLDRAGFTPWPADVPPFSCDAIWMSGVADAFTVVCGPGDLVANRAHADGEYVDLADLDRFAAGIRALLTSLAQGVLPCS